MNKKSKIFIWSSLKTWDSFIRGLMPHGTVEEVEAAIRQKQELFQLDDNPEPFKNIYSEFSDFDSLEKTFVSTFSANFNFVRMFHCCRPRSVESYYAQGIHPLLASEANKQFRKLCLGSDKFPIISENDIKDAIDSMTASADRFGQVYFGLDDRFLIRFCDHYLTHGSEYLQCLFRYLQRRLGYDLNSQLMQLGTPTVFQVNISINQFKSEEIDALADGALSAWAYCIAHDKREPWQIDFAINLDETLLPESIVAHYHPK